MPSKAAVEAYPFRDRKSRYICFSTITREPLKIRRQVKHCKKGFCELFPMRITKMSVCIWMFWENRVILIFCPVWANFFHTQRKIPHAYVLIFGSGFWLRLLARTITNHQCQKMSLTIVVGDEKFGWKKRSFWKFERAIFRVFALKRWK